MNIRVIVALVAVVAQAACSEPVAVVIEPLRIINWSPASGAFCSGVDTVVSATFSDDLVPSSVNPESFHLLSSDGPVPAALVYDSASYTIRLTPSARLDFERLYTAVATTELRGREHGRLAVDVDASFLTLARTGCVPGLPECQLPSDCPGSQICSSIGTCIDACVTDKDCYHAACTLGTCVPSAPADGGPPDSGPDGGGDAGGDGDGGSDDDGGDGD